MGSDQSTTEEDILVTINPDDVLFVATLIHGLDKAPSFIYNTRNHPFRWGPFDVYALQYPDGTKYAVKVPTQMADRPRIEISNMIESEAANLEKLALVNFKFAPRPIRFSATFANHLRFPYIITTWIEGKPLVWNDRFPAKEKHRQEVLRYVLVIIYELVRCTLQFEADPTMTADRALVDKIDKKVLRAIRQQMDGLSLRDCLALRFLARIISIIPSVIYGDPEESNTPNSTAASALVHDDLVASNILVDENYRPKGFINWSIVKRLPLRYVFKLPRFLTIDPNPFDTVTTDIHALHAKYLQPSMRLEHERRFFAETYCWIVVHRALGTVLSSTAPLCTDTQDLDWKHLILFTIFSTKLHKWMAKNDYLLPGTVAGERLLGSYAFDEYVKNEAVLFCEARLAAFSSESRKNKAVQVLKGAIQRGRGWDWLERWLAVQFIKMTDS